MRFAVIACLFSLPLFHAACGDNGGGDPMGPDNDPFDTFQDCFDDHHGEEDFPVHDAIEICCIDHPIGADDMNVVCGNTAAACEAYVEANLEGPDVTTDLIDSACTDYVVDRAG